MEVVDARSARIQRSDRAQRWVSILVGLGVIFVAGWMTLEAMTPHAIKKDASSEAGGAAASAAASSSAASASATTPVLIGDASLAEQQPTSEDGGLFMPTLSLDAGVALGSGAPRHVKIGVVLVAYQGAEGASANARSKADARVIADRLVQEAKTDFHHAVTSGDSGSMDDIGRIPRGVLDPRTEASVFALGSGEVSEVLETPKGFWIVKRND